MDRPLPYIYDLNRYFWDGAREGRLVLQRCSACASWVHPPRESCPSCQSEALVTEQASGKGHVYSWTVMTTKGNPGFENKLPYPVVVVELAEQKGLFLVSNVDYPVEELKIGLPLEVFYEKLTDEVTLPQWRPAKESAR